MFICIDYIAEDNWDLQPSNFPVTQVLIDQSAM